MNLNVSISNLPVSENFSPKDLLMISRQTSEEIYSSYSITASEVMDDFSSFFENKDPVEKTTGNWKFNPKDKYGVYVDSSNIKFDNSAINVDYAQKRFMSVLSLLSVEIYSRQHIPSNIGEVIYSTSLNNVEKVRSKYGRNTDWEQIQGRFIMAADHDIECTAGEAKVNLTIENIPKHGHNVSPEDNERNITVNKTIAPKISSVCFGAPWDNGVPEALLGPSYNDGFPIYTGGRGGGMEGRKLILDFAVTGSGAEEEGDSTCEIRINSNVIIEKNSGNNIGHNNIPPFYSVYMWRRVK